MTEWRASGSLEGEERTISVKPGTGIASSLGRARLQQEQKESELDRKILEAAREKEMREKQLAQEERLAKVVWSGLGGVRQRWAGHQKCLLKYRLRLHLDNGRKVETCQLYN